LITIELVGMVWVMATVTGATILTLAVANAAGFAVAVAVMVTTPLWSEAVSGTVGGAVKVSGAPLAVWAWKLLPGEKEPHGVFAQLTIQSTPAFEESLETVAMTVDVALVSSELGGGWVMLTEAGALTVNDVEALKLWSACANAVRVIVVPRSTGGELPGPGTIKLALPLRLENKPGGVQFTVPQVTFQSTPEFEGSPATAAATTVCAPKGTALPARISVTGACEGRDAGGGCVMVTPETVDRMVTVAAELLL
jgi:hypothetical protein